MKRNITLDGSSPAGRERVSAPTRELARRLSGKDEVLLLWRPATRQVELSVLDRTTGAGFYIEVAATNAIDSFYHPYAYAPSHEDPCCMGVAEGAISDG